MEPRPSDGIVSRCRSRRRRGRRPLSRDDDRNLEALTEALQARTRAAELADEDRYRALFAAEREHRISLTSMRTVSDGALPQTPDRVLTRIRLSPAATVLALLTAGTGAGAAYAGSLPTPLQAVAHRAIGAPAPERDAPEGSSSTPGQSTLAARPTPSPSEPSAAPGFSPLPTPATTPAPARTARPDRSFPARSTTGTADPGTADPGTTDPITADPGASDLFVASPGATQPARRLPVRAFRPDRPDRPAPPVRPEEPFTKEPNQVWEVPSPK